MKDKKKGRSIRGKVREMANESTSNLNFKGSTWGPKEAKTYKLIILPYEVKSKQPEAKKGELWFRRQYWTHNNIGLEGSKKSYVCPKSFNKKCPVCEDLEKLYKEYDDNEKTISSIKQKKREIYNVVEYKDFQKFLRGKVKLKDIIQIFEYSWYGFGKKLKEEIKESDEEKGYDGFADCIDGKVLNVRFVESDLKGRKPFYEASRIDFEDREDLKESLVLKSVHNLDEILSPPSYKQLKNIYYELEGEEEEDDDDDDDDDTDTDEDEDEDEDEEEENEEDDTDYYEEEEDATDEEDDDTDDDKEEEKPTKKSNIKRGRKKEKEKPSKKEKEKEKPKPTKKEKKKSAKKCPHKHKFGKDCGDFNECDKCKKFDDCVNEM